MLLIMAMMMFYLLPVGKERWWIVDDVDDSGDVVVDVVDGSDDLVLLGAGGQGEVVDRQDHLRAA